MAYVFGGLIIGIGRGYRKPGAPPPTLFTPSAGEPEAPAKTIRCKHRLGDNVEMRGGTVAQFCDRCGNWIEAKWPG